MTPPPFYFVHIEHGYSTSTGINNPTAKDRQLIAQLHSESSWGAYQDERGELKGTLHIQGCVYFKYGKSESVVRRKYFPRCLGNSLSVLRNGKASKAYCSKPESRVDGTEPTLWGKIPDYVLSHVSALPEEVFIDPLEGVQLYPYQKRIVDLAMTKPDRRTIYWFWEHEGNSGKSSLVRHLLATRTDVALCGGRAIDAAFAIAQRQKQKLKSKVVIFDIPRSNKNHVCYNGIEMIKNGVYFSPKYESGQILFNYPHVVILANFPPMIDRLSVDRWCIHEISKDFPKGKPVADPEKGLTPGNSLGLGTTLDPRGMAPCGTPRNRNVLSHTNSLQSRSFVTESSLDAEDLAHFEEVMDLL